MSAFLTAAAIVACYVGSDAGSPDGQSLCVLACDAETGAAKVVQRVADVQGTTYFQLDAGCRHLYSVIGGMRDAKAVSWAVRFPVCADGRLGPVERLAELPCEAPCHVALTPDGRRVAFAAYGSATAGTVGIDGGGLRSFTFPDDAMGPNRLRQQKAYAHQSFSLPDGTLGVVDLGCDRIRFFDPATMRRVPKEDIKADSGDGPRHAVVSKDGRFLFVVNELGSSVASYALAGGTPKRMGKWSTLPETFDRWCADGKTLATKAAAIRLTDDGKILMASNRGFDSIAFYDVDGETGCLSLRNIAKLTGRFPRDFALLPGEKFMLVGHKLSNEVQVYRFRRETCGLTPQGAPIPIWRPLCFAINKEVER